MADVFETQTILVDPNGPIVSEVNLDKDFNVQEVAILTNTVKANGVREITLGIIYDDAVTNQHTLSLETILVGNSIADAAPGTMADDNIIKFVEFIDHTLKDDSISVTILTISEIGAGTNIFHTMKIQLDPSSPITTGVPVTGLDFYSESHLVNVGSLTKTSSVAQGTVNAVLIIVAFF